MNKVILIGRLTKNPEQKTTQTNIAVCNFTLAVQRKFKKDEVDFISCVAWKQTAEFVVKYFTKGLRVAVCGSLQTRVWDKEGVKHNVVEVMVDEVDFADGKSQNDAGQRSESSEGNYSKTKENDFRGNFEPLDDDESESELPF
jgi:single-strand DNA-binding protein